MGVFAMPSLGSDMEAGTLVEWLVEPGDTVKRGDVIAVVETQKGAIEIETFEEGTVHALTAELGRKLPVGAPLAVILGEGEAPPAEGPSAAPAEAPAAAEAAPVEAQRTAEHQARLPEAAGASAAQPTAERIAEPSRAPAAPRPGTPSPGCPAASPAARMRAKKLGVDLATLAGSGPGGAILIGDVEHATGARETGGDVRAPRRARSAMDEMRRAIAAAMTRAKRTIPHVYLSQTIDVAPATAFLEQRNADKPPAERVLLGALFVRAATLAAAKVPVLNGHYEEPEGFRQAEGVNPGVAVALRGGGLVAPALMDAERMTLDETMAGMRDLVTRARAGRLKSSEMTQGTLTVSSLGESGAEAMTGVIFPPQVALIGLGAPQVRPWVVEGEVVPRTLVTLTVSADHRVADGRQVARFIAAFDDLMQRPEEL